MVSKRIKLTQLVSYVKSAVERDESGGRDRFVFHDVGTVKKVSIGRGILYSWVQGVDLAAMLLSQFVMLQDAQVEHAQENDQIIVDSQTLPMFPACGIITSGGEGFVLAPSLKLDVNKGKNMVLMVLSPTTSPRRLSVEKNILNIPKAESTMSISTDGDELHSLGLITGRSKTTKIIINRNPHLPVYRAGFNETLTTLKGRGRISATWKPVARSFEELVLIFYPSRMIQINPDSLSLAKIPEHLGLSTNPGAQRSEDFVLGDGPGIEYALRLKTGFGLRRSASAQTRLTVG